MPLIFFKRGRVWLVLLTLAIALVGVGVWIAADGGPYWPLLHR